MLVRRHESHCLGTFDRQGSPPWNRLPFGHFPK
ncbi:hypothetical protein SAMN05443665_10922 [Actinomadura meyerae]|uniref:Uncharacterized protein n=1 Tax=Actinomadura meyerae TaxID=240840 RepID=A0A239P8T5_9ACTN|nr:hypothetical protein SAMN05443665_10922 [Actinomadura meyerae]